MFSYTTKGVCSKQINIDTKDGVIKNVDFVGGCNGSLNGIGVLVNGMRIEEAIKKLKGVKCGQKTTSCPEQLAFALESMLHG